MEHKEEEGVIIAKYRYNPILKRWEFLDVAYGDNNDRDAGWRLAYCNPVNLVMLPTVSYEDTWCEPTREMLMGED